MLNESLYELFLYYLHERETIRIKKESGDPKPWTQDKILQNYKFTNVLRENDRTTKWMRENWTKPNLTAPLEIQLLNCGIFRYFGSIEFAEEIGFQNEFNPKFLKETAERMLSEKRKVFTGAYVITNNGIVGPKQDVVVDKFLTPFNESLEEIVRISRATQSWMLACQRLMKVYGFGGSGFMAKETLSDAIHTPVLNDCTDRYTWSPVGPGALRGLNRLHNRPLSQSLKEPQALEEMKGLFIRFSSDFKSFMPRVGQEFDLHCVQFGLCEIDKYIRLRDGTGKVRAGYKGA